MRELSLEDHDRLVSALMASLATGPEQSAPQRIETHISSVILSGEFAYKIKKPVNFGFLDFTTLERRRHFCEEEIRLNGRLAPQIYLDVVPITGSVTAPLIDGAGEAVEFAVRMQRFSQDALLSHLAETHSLPIEAMDAVAEQLASFHAQAARATADSEFSAPEAALFPVQENFEQVRPVISDPDSIARIDRLEQWSLEQFASLREQLAERGVAGWIRECHGDMHLGNMALIDASVVIFDGIEFNDRMRWTDVLADVAFLAMDLDDRGLYSHGNRFLNAWFERTGDYPALPLLNFYRVYRAMVRAKIAALRFTQDLTVAEREQVQRDYHGYTDLAERYTRKTEPLLCITHGLSGSGKSKVAGRVVDGYGLLRIRSDVERKRLHGLAASERSGSGIDGGIYNADATQGTYIRLADIAEKALRAGFSVVVDAAFLKAWQRQMFAELAARLGLAFLILDIDVPLPTLRERLIRRSRRRNNVSEADLEVLEKQLASHEPLAGDELAARRRVTAEGTAIDTALAPFVGQLPARR